MPPQRSADNTFALCAAGAIFAKTHSIRGRQSLSLCRCGAEGVLSLVVLFAWSFAAATILPLSSEIPLALVIRNSGGWLVPVLVATAGNTLGACTTYGLARAAVAVATTHGERTRRASALLAKYGAPAMLLSWVPLVGDVLVLLAGAARMPVWRFIGWTTLGKASRYVVVALALERF